MWTLPNYGLGMERLEVSCWSLGLCPSTTEARSAPSPAPHLPISDTTTSTPSVTNINLSSFQPGMRRGGTQHPPAHMSNMSLRPVISCYSSDCLSERKGKREKERMRELVTQGMKETNVKNLKSLSNSSDVLRHSGVAEKMALAPS